MASRKSAQGSPPYSSGITAHGDSGPFLGGADGTHLPYEHGRTVPTPIDISALLETELRALVAGLVSEKQALSDQHATLQLNY